MVMEGSRFFNGLVVAGSATLDYRQRQLLQLQDDIWQEECERFLDLLEVEEGMRIIEYGCGMGLDLPRLARRVGPNGEVVGIEGDPLLAEHCRQELRRQGIKNVRVVLGDDTFEPIPEGQFQRVFWSWKVGIQVAPSPALLRARLQQLRAKLDSDGLLGVWELHLGGLSLLPSTPALSQLFASLGASGSQAALALPGQLTACGFLLEHARPHQKACPPGSAVYRWVEETLRWEVQRLGLGSEAVEEIWREWEARRVDPQTLLFSPQMLGLVARCF